MIRNFCIITLGGSFQRWSFFKRRSLTLLFTFDTFTFVCAGWGGLVVGEGAVGQV